MRRIQRIQPSPHVQGRYLVFFEGEKLLKVTEDEMLRFSLCAGLTLEEDTYAELTRCASRSQAMSAAARIIGVVSTSAYIYLVPALTGAASALVLGEPVTAPIVAGVALTIAGLMLSTRTKSTCKLHRSTPATQPDKAFLCRKLR